MSVVEMVPYRDSWRASFRSVADELAGVMAGCSARIEHIGSTAVPGLCAKPVLDVLLGVRLLTQVEAEIDQMAGLGYRYRPEYEDQIPQRRYFVRGATATVPRVHVHAVVHGDRLWQEHLAFRDALRQDPELARQYSHLKQELALAQRLSKSAYTEAKAPFIKGVLAACRTWD